MQNKDSNLINEGFLASLLAVFSFGKQVKMLRKMYSKSKDPEIQDLGGVQTPPDRRRHSRK